jgi:hypothetical protein
MPWENWITSFHGEKEDQILKWWELVVWDKSHEIFIFFLIMNCIIWKDNLVAFKAIGLITDDFKSEWLHENPEIPVNNI